MNLESLRIFVNSVKLGSFAAVARQMELGPSTISRSITNLEAELGFRLFQRTTRMLVPTEAGSVYFERVKGLIDSFDIAGQEAQDLVNRPQGNLRVAACTSFGPRVLVPLLPKVMELYPELSIELLLADHQTDIVKDEIDISIRFGLKPAGDFVSAQLRPRRFSICASPGFIQKHGSPSSPEDIQSLQCIIFRMPGQTSTWRFRDKDGEVEEVPVSGKLMTSHGLTMTAAAVSGLGISILPDWLCLDELENGSLINLFPDLDCTPTDFETAAWIMYPSRNYLPLKVRKFIDFLKAEIGGNA